MLGERPLGDVRVFTPITHIPGMQSIFSRERQGVDYAPPCQ